LYFLADLGFVTGAPTTWLLPDEFVGVPLSGTYDCDRSVSNDYRCGGDPSYGTGEGDAAAEYPRATGIVVSHLYRTDTLACNEIIDSTSCTARWSLP
jgi:hypothetical protein